jgi:hypothetical protein
VARKQPVRTSHYGATRRYGILASMMFYAVVDDSLPHFTARRGSTRFIRREDAERFIEQVRGDEPELASYLRIEEREL